MPDPALLETFPTPTDSPFVIEHVNEEFTSLCPVSYTHLTLPTN